MVSRDRRLSFDSGIRQTVQMVGNKMVILANNCRTAVCLETKAEKRLCFETGIKQTVQMVGNNTITQERFKDEIEAIVFVGVIL